MRVVKAPQHAESCRQYKAAITDTMDLLTGKWKIHILGTLLREGRPMRFKDLQREVEGIAAKMLSKELRDMEMNHLVTRTVMNTKPISVEYAVTDFGLTLSPIIDEMVKWGLGYRKSVYAMAK